MQPHGWNLIRESTSKLEQAPWEQLAPQLENHKLSGLIYSRLKRELPLAWKTEFKQAWKQQASRNLISMRELHSLLEYAKQRHIPVVLLKGAAFLKSIYQDWGARNLSDIDLLISDSDHPEFARTLRSLGFHPRPKQSWMGDRFKTEYIKSVNGIEVVFEIHTQLFYHHSSLQWWRKLARNYGLYYELHPEDFLIYLTGHAGFQHTFLKLYWVKDIDLFIRKHADELNWEDMLIKARDLKLKRSFLTALYITHEYLGTPLPKSILKVLDKETSRFVRYSASADQLWQGKKMGLRYYMLKALTKDSLWDFVHYSWKWTLHRLFRPKKAKGLAVPAHG